MHASKQELNVDLDGRGLEMRGVDWGVMHVSWESHREGTDFAPLFEGVPGNFCSSPHWGYVLKGVFVAEDPEGGQERIEAGNVYFLEPGHKVSTEPGTEVIEFSLQEDLARIMPVVEKNLPGWLEDER